MITVTSAPSAITTSTPVTDGIANSGTSTPNEGFTSALSVQLGLAAPTVDGNGTPILQQTQSTLLANTLENAPITTLSTQQPAALINAQIETPIVLNLPTDLPETVLSVQDEAILSNVTDTLKFIATGSKLGDTLAAGQSVQLQHTNVSTPITQQTIQSVVQQAVTNTQVNTSAAVLAQQVMPVQVGEALVETAQAELDPTVILSQVQNAVAGQIQTTEKPVAQAQAQVQVQTSVVQSEVEATQKTAITAQAQVQTPVVQSEVEATQKPALTAQGQVQTEVEIAQKPAVIAQGQVQTEVESAQKPAVTAQGQIQTPVDQVETTKQSVVTAQAQVQTLVAQAETTKQSVVTAQTQVQTPVDQTEVTEKAVLATPVQKVIREKLAQTTDENTQITAPILVTEIAAQAVTQNVVVEENIVEQEAVTPQTQQSDNQDEQPVQVAAKVLAPIVTAQAVPIQVEVDAPTFETPSSSSAPEDKPTLTPAKNLLADAIASRANGGDTAANNGDKRGTDTPTNPSLQADNSLKTSAENRQASDTKPFASLLAAEKSDVTTATATSTTPTAEKSAPQVMAAVNKLAESVKTEVPALTRPLSHPSWNEDMGERIVWMNNRGISSAEIRMNPQNMGPITVRIDMNQDQATIAFTAQNADVRTALEASIPKLREMLTSQNVNLADVNVSQQSSTNADSGRSQQQAAQMAADASANGQGGNRQNQEVDANGNPVHSANANGEEIAVDEFANGQVLQDNGSNGLLSIFA